MQNTMNVTRRNKNVAKRHLLNLSKKAQFSEFKHVTVDGVDFTFSLYTYGNASGFVHFAKLWVSPMDVMAHAKAQYYNRTWERFEGQSVYRQCVEWALKSNDITQEQAEFLKEALR